MQKLTAHLQRDSAFALAREEELHPHSLHTAPNFPHSSALSERVGADTATVQDVASTLIIPSV